MGRTVRGSNSDGGNIFAPTQTCPGAHLASYTMGTGSFLGVKQPGCGVDHPPPSRAEVKERVELYLYSTSGPSWPVLGWTLPTVYVIAVNSTKFQYVWESNICCRIWVTTTAIWHHLPYPLIPQSQQYLIHIKKCDYTTELNLELYETTFMGDTCQHL